MNKHLFIAAVALASISSTMAEEGSPCLPENDPELTFKSNSPAYKHIVEENNFVVKKYAEHSLNSGPWFSHVFNPSHTVVVFIGMLPPSGSNIYQFWVYQKKDAKANTSGLDVSNNEWEYVGEYSYTSVHAPWDFENIAFDGKTISIKIKDKELDTVLVFSFDLNKKQQSFQYRDSLD